MKESASNLKEKNTHHWGSYFPVLKHFYDSPVKYKLYHF